MSRLAIIPARGGSKRIPKKNIKDFLGKPIIAYSIEAAINSNLFDEVLVSTDDDSIAEIAQKFGAKVPFYRSDINANDFATLADVINEVLNRYKQENMSFDNFCCILPTAPFVNGDTLVRSYRLFEANNYDSLIPVVRFSYPIQRSLMTQEGLLKFKYPEFENTRSQDLEEHYHDVGQFYWGNSKSFAVHQTLFMPSTGMIEVSEKQVQDIDTMDDWEIAELKFKLINNLS